MSRGTYIDPSAGRELFGNYAEAWLKARHVETTTAARTSSVLRVHVLPRWERWLLAKITHREIQGWVNELSSTLAPASVARCYGALSMILAAAVRERLIGVNPAERVNLPSAHKPRRQAQALPREDFFGRLRVRRDWLGDAYKPGALVFPGGTGEGVLRASFRRDVAAGAGARRATRHGVGASAGDVAWCLDRCRRDRVESGIHHGA